MKAARKSLAVLGDLRDAWGKEKASETLQRPQSRIPKHLQATSKGISDSVAESYLQVSGRLSVLSLCVLDKARFEPATCNPRILVWPDIKKSAMRTREKTSSEASISMNLIIRSRFCSREPTQSHPQCEYQVGVDPSYRGILLRSLAKRQHGMLALRETV